MTDYGHETPKTDTISDVSGNARDMSATERLRAMLDERGVEWKAHGYENHTWWNDADGVGWHAENRPSVNGVYAKIEAVLTPEQAIAATLGNATTHPRPHERWTTVLLPDIAWLDGTWPDYLSVAHDEHGEWRVYVPEVTDGRKVVDE